jgi:hypothetical protein
LERHAKCHTLIAIAKPNSDRPSCRFTQRMVIGSGLFDSLPLVSTLERKSPFVATDA